MYNMDNELEAIYDLNCDCSFMTNRDEFNRLLFIESNAYFTSFAQLAMKCYMPGTGYFVIALMLIAFRIVFYLIWNI